MGQSRILKIKTLASTKFLSLYDAEYKNKLGNQKNWTIASRKNKEVIEDQLINSVEDKVDAVVIVALHKESKKLVVVKQYRVPLANYVVELPAGLIDNNEEIINSCNRELMEETGLSVVEVIDNKSCDKLYLSPGMTDESVSLIYCLCDGEISTENLEEDEDIEPLLLSREEAKNLLDSNIRFDIKCYMILKSFIDLGEKLF